MRPLCAYCLLCLSADEVEPDNDDTEAANTDLASSSERAKNIIDKGQLSLDTKLGVFVIQGSQEPRLVKLYPREPCSCPAMSSCYHIIAAKMAVGMPVSQRPRTLNLAQLRHNKRKRTDKTSGRKRPRLNDVDVEGADDADDDTATQLIPRVTGAGEASSSQTTAVAAVSSDVDQSICPTCDMPEPPDRKRRVNAATISWMGCDYCPQWYHRVCVGMVNDTSMDNYRCDLCI